MLDVNGSDRVPIQRPSVGPEGQHSYVRLEDLFAFPLARAEVPAAVAAYVAAEQGLGVTKLTLTDLPISIVSVTTGNGVGGTKILDLPLGFINRRACRAVLSCRVATAYQADYTDATPEGDLGVGTVAPANADAFGTDATDDDWGTGAAFLMAAYADASVVLGTEAAGVQDGSVTAKDLYLNALVDAADIDDGVTTQLLVSGTIWILWDNQGGA